MCTASACSCVTSACLCLNLHFKFVSALLPTYNFGLYSRIQSHEHSMAEIRLQRKNYTFCALRKWLLRHQHTHMVLQNWECWVSSMRNYMWLANSFSQALRHLEICRRQVIFDKNWNKTWTPILSWGKKKLSESEKYFIENKPGNVLMFALNEKNIDSKNVQDVWMSWSWISSSSSFWKAELPAELQTLWVCNSHWAEKNPRWD